MVQRKSFNHIPAQTARTLTGVRRMAVMLLMMLSTTITLYAETKLELTCVVVSDLAEDADRVSPFTITLDDTTVNGTYGDLEITNGVATVTLKGGESVSATDLAKGICYTIEQDYDGDEFDLTTDGKTGTISDNKSTATFTYTRKTSSGSQTTTYGLSTGTSEHGTLSFKVGDNDNATSAAEGAEVIVTVNAATGWQTSGVTAEASTTWDQASARRRTGSTSDIPFANITPTKVDGTTNQWRFTMPPANVTVSATYKKVIQASWIQDITAVTYNGTGQTPTVTVKDGTTMLVENTDYTVSYSNNVNAALSTATTNAPTVTITAVATSDKYAGTATKTFTISPKAVTVTAKSEAFTYDGTAHSNAGYDVEGLVGSDAISAVVEGSITFPRESPVTNTLKSYSFTTGTAGNYSVTTVNGQLTMTNANQAITITAASQSWTYDGIAHTNTTVTLTSGALFTGDELVAEATGSVTDVADTQTGNNPVKAGYKVMHGTEDVTASYVITAVAGTLTISEAAASLAFAKAAFEKTYGDADFTNELTVTGGSSVAYSSDKPKIASVNAKTGEVTVLRAGTATITAELNDKNYISAKASFKVTVSEKVVSDVNGTSITLDADGYHIYMDETVGPGMVIPDYITYADVNYARLLDISDRTAVNIDGEDRYLFTVCEPFDPNFNAKFYTLTGVGNGSLRFDEIEGKAKARTPYLVSTTHSVAVKDAYSLDVVIEGHKLTEEEKDAVLYTYEAEMSFSWDVINPDPVDGYQLKGTLRGLTNADAAAEGALILQSDGRWGAVKAGNEDVYIPPFRAYVVGATQNARTFDSSFGDGATGIERIVTIDRDGTEHWYDLQGRPIERPATKGIYIHNGRKEAVK